MAVIDRPSGQDQTDFSYSKCAACTGQLMQVCGIHVTEVSNIKISFLIIHSKR